MKKKIPKFKTEKEAAEFWSKNSPLDYPDEFKEIKDPFEFSIEFLEKIAKTHKEKKQSVTLRVEHSVILLAKIIANSRGDYYQALIRTWIKNGIRRELKENPKMKQKIREQQLHLLSL